MYYTYVLESLVANKHYYGQTDNLEKRVSDHNSGLSGYTKRYAPWKLVYYEKFDNRSDARKRENFFKSFSDING